MLVLVNQHGRALGAAVAVLLEVATLAVAAGPGALLVAAPAPRQPFMVAAFGEHRLFLAVVRTLPVEVSAD